MASLYFDHTVKSLIKFSRDSWAPINIYI